MRENIKKSECLGMYMHLQLTLFVFWSFVLDTWMHIDLFICACRYRGPSSLLLIWPSGLLLSYLK